MQTLPCAAARLVTIGDWILYRNQYDQLFNAKVVRKHLADDGRLFLIVKREEWRTEECLPYSEFENGNYVLLV